MDGLDLTTPDTASHAARYRVQLPRHRRPSWVRRHVTLTAFLICVGIPTLISSIYFFAFAADQYVSEAKFVVRGQAMKAPSGLSSLLDSTGVTHSDEDTFAVQDFITSRDALSELVSSENIKAVFDRPEADPLSRFPIFAWNATFEHFYEYYKKHIDVQLDTSTGVSTLTVKTFRPDDSHRIAVALLASAENLINRMNERQRDNAMRDARKELGVAEGRVETVAQKIAEFRNREALLDPTKQSVPMLAGINELQTMLSRTELQISQLVTSTPRSPLIPDLRRRADALQGQITDARSKITGGDSSLVPKIAAFDMLELQRQFADRQLVSATSSLESARLQAERQQLYLETIVKPNVSDYAAYPKRISSIFVIFASLSALFAMAALIIAGAREHRIS